MNKKIRAAALILAVTLLMSGCTSIFTKRDTLTFTDVNPGSGSFLTTKLSSYTDGENAILLYYCPQTDAALYCFRETRDEKTVWSLYIFDPEGERLLYSGQNAYTSGMIDPYDNSIYFKETDYEDMAVTLYRSDYEATVKTSVMTHAYGAALPYTVSKGRLIYADKDGNLTEYVSGKYTVLYTFTGGSGVKKLCTDRDGSVVYALLSISSKSNLLCSVRTETGDVTSIDAGVSDFIVNDYTGKLYYVKNAGSRDQLYMYSPDSYQHSLIYSGSVDRIAVSPGDTYLAFTTRSSESAISQSLWIITLLTKDTVQMVSGTTFYGNIYFSSAKTVMLTAAETTEQTTNYHVKTLEFETDYSGKEQK